jgi:hypothetical protein
MVRAMFMYQPPEIARSTYLNKSWPTLAARNCRFRCEEPLVSSQDLSLPEYAVRFSRVILSLLVASSLTLDLLSGRLAFPPLLVTIGTLSMNSRVCNHIAIASK